jgi:DNA-binding beta-propeller fold protein YncE
MNSKKVKAASLYLHNYLSVLYLCLFLFFLSSCAAPTSKAVKLVYPSPPEEPRLAYLDSYKGESNFIKKGFFDFILGEEQSSAELQKPYGVTAYGDKLYVTDTQGAIVFVFDLKERKVTFLGDKDMGRLALPTGVAVTSDGIVFVSDAKQKRVFGYDANGNLQIALGKKDEFKNPGGMAVNNDLGRLYIVDSYGHMVHVYSTKGEPLFTFGARGGEDGEFNFPSNVAVDRKTGNVAVVDTQNFRVQVFDKDGKFINKFGQVGDAPGAFTRPKGIGFDSEGHMYVADAAFDNLQIFDDKGQLLLSLGSAGHEPGYFWLPAGVYVDEKDKVYIVDSFNHRIQVFQYLSEKWKKENPGKYKEYLLK